MPTEPATKPFNVHLENGALIFGITDLAIKSAPGIRRQLREIYQPLDYSVQFVTLPAIRSLVLSNNGKTDGETLRIADIGNRNNLIRIEEPLLSTELRVWSKPDLIYSSFAELSQFQAVVVNGTMFHKNTSAMLGSDTLTAPNIISALKMIKSSRADFIVYNDAILTIAESIGLGTLVASVEVYSQLNFYHYVNAKHADKVKAITEQIKLLKQKQIQANH